MNCHVCNTKYSVKAGKILKCPNCTHEYLVYEGDSIEYHTKQFRKDSTHHRAKKEFIHGKVQQAFHDARHKICVGRVGLLHDYIGECNSLLDIGSGAGTFAHTIRKHIVGDFPEIHCLELDPALIEECERLGFPTFKDEFLTAQINQTYDMVTAWHVLEHIKDIRAFMEKAISLSNKYVVIEIPHKRKVPQTYDGHSHHFTKRSFNTFCDSLELEEYAVIEGIQRPALCLIGKT